MLPGSRVRYVKAAGILIQGQIFEEIESRKVKKLRLKMCPSPESTPGAHGRDLSMVSKRKRDVKSYLTEGGELRDFCPLFSDSITVSLQID